MNNAIPENVSNHDQQTVAESQGRSSNENSAHPKFSLDEMIERRNQVKGIDLDSLMEIAKSKESDMQNIHASIYMQHVTGSTPLSTRQVEQIEAFVAEHPDIDISEHMPKEETANA